MSDIKKIKDEYLDKLNNELSIESINQSRIELFGKSGIVSNEFKKLSFIPEKERKQAKVKKTRGKKGKSQYNKFVAEQSPIVRKENPGMKQPQVMKEIAKRWKSQK